MGHAWHAPMDEYRRKRLVSAHAVERLRERAELDLAHRSDEDVGNLLDSAVHSASLRRRAGYRNVRTRETDAGGRAFWVVDLSRDLGASAFALVSACVVPGFREVVLTVLTVDMVERSRATKHWVGLFPSDAGVEKEASSCKATIANACGADGLRRMLKPDK